MTRSTFTTAFATLSVLAIRAAAESCEEVWFVEGSFVGETFTCGERIVYLQTPQGGGKTEQEARVQASLEELKCADCWPWEKYREDGETERSPKRGIAIENHKLTPESLSGLSQIVSWGVTWHYNLTDGPDLEVWNMAGVDFVPLIWGAGSLPLAQADGLPEGRSTLLGFNEPNFPNQANLDPETAANLWKDVEALAEEHNISTIVSPSMNWHVSMDPIEWLERFFAACEGCQVDAIGIHVFTCYAAGLKYHLDRYRVFGKPMWITEIACSNPNSPERLSAEGQMAYMMEAIPLLEADEDVAKYAWFSYFKNEWEHPIVDGENGDAGLIFPNGTLTPLGKLYKNFAAGTNLTEINITEPSSTTTVSQTKTVTSTTSITATGSSTQTFTGETSSTKESTEPTTESTTTTAAESSTSSTVEATAPTTESTTVAESTTESTTASTTASTAASTSQEPSSVSQTTATQSSTESSTTKEETSTTTLQKEKVTTPLRSLSTMTAPSTTLPEGGESTTTEEVDQEENVTNETFSCTEAVDAWCQSDPASAPFFPLRHCSDWRLHDAMCSSPGGGKNNAPQFAGTTELEDSGSFPALFLLLAVLGAAMAGAALASLFYRRQNHKCILCCGRNKKEEQEQEDLKRAISQKSDWQGNCLPVMCNRNGPNSKVAPEPGLLLPMEAVARRVGSSPVAAEVCGSPVIGTLSKKGNAPEVAVGTPVGTTPASRAAALSTLTEAMAKATSADVSLDEREIALHQAGRVLCSKAALNLPLALRQEAETWHSRQEERLNLAKSMEAVVERAANLEEAAECEATAADPLGALLSRAVVADKVELEALLGESARRASAFEDELDNQRIRLHREPRPANQSLLTAADLMKQTSDLTEMQTKAARELTELQALQDPGAGEEWKTACDSLETKWKQFVADSGAAVQEAQAALAANRTAKILSSDAEREAALAEAARRQATFQEELQKQRQKLQKRTKAKSAAPTPLELGRLLEDEGVLQALELDRDTAMKECQQFIDTAEARHCDAEAKQWKELLQGWQIVKEDMAQVASSNQELSEAMPEATVWASAASKAKIGKVTVDDDEQLALLAEAARCAAAFDEELQKQRQQMKKRRKALQKGGSEQATDPLDVCRTMADEEALKRLSRQQAEAHAKCQAMATSGEGMSEAWEQLAATWVQMEKDINKAEKEVSEASKVVTSDAHSELVAALGLAQDGEVARDAEDGNASQREALQEAARRIAVFDEELAKQRAAMRRRRSENPQGANALGAALLEGEALKALAAECAEAVAVCEAAAAEASKEGGQAEPWQDILKVWANLRADLAEATEEAEAEAKICRAHEASEALAAHGVAAAARRAVAFEHELGQLTREGAHESGAVEADVRRAHKTALVQKLKTEHAEGLAFCEAKVAATRAEEETPHLVECRNAWQELVELWQGLGKDLETAAQELATSTEPAGALRKILDASVSDAERQKALAEAARRAAQFDEELQRQRQRLVRRKKVGENISSRVLALGDAVELQALAADQEAAKSACQDALTKAEASNDVEQAQGWKQIMDVYVALDNELDAQKKEIQATGSFSAEPAAEAGRQMVQKVIRDQKQSAESCLKAVEHALNTDRGPLEGLIEAQQAPRSVKSNGGSTHRSRHLEAAAQVQTWDVLEEAQGVLESLKKQSPGKPVAMENLKQLGDEASKQLKEISDQAKAVKQESTVTQDEKPSETPSVKRGQRDFGCQTVFRLGGMAWHANPAIQKLLEELAKVSTQGGSGQETANLDKLEGEVNEVINHWRKEFIGKRREASITRITRSRSRSQSRLMPEAPSPASAPPTSPPAPPAPPTMLEADLVAQAAKKKEVEAAPASPALDNIKRDEVRVEIESTSFQSSQFDNNKPAPSMDQVLDDSRRPETEDARPPSGNLSSRRIQADSRRMSTGSTNSDYEDQSANRQRRRRSSSRDGRIDLGASVDSSRPTQPEPEVPKEPPQHGHQGEEPQGEFLAQLEQMRVSGSQAASVSEDHRDSKNLPRPSSASSRRGGPGDGSLLVPPAGDAASRSVSPSSAGSSPSPGHSAPRRLDPLVRPRGPPLPSAGRLLLASQQENIFESAKTSPRSGH